MQTGNILHTGFCCGPVKTEIVVLFYLYRQVGAGVRSDSVMRFVVYLTIMLIAQPVTAQTDIAVSNTDSLMASAEAGDRNCQFELARRYAEGNGVRRDYKKAVYWLKKSAEQGHTEARFYLGWLYLHGKAVHADRLNALHWLELAAQSDDAYAQYLTGKIYEEGGHPEAFSSADTVKAEHWYRRACANHIALACERLNKLKMTVR